MQTLQRAMVKATIFTFLLTTVFAVKAYAGLDGYSIYLNNKLLVKQTVNQPLSLKSLQLDQSNKNDQLIIRYDQCNTLTKVGKGRSLVVKDEKGNVIKEWKFADVTSTDARMVIAVKELLALERNAPKGVIQLFYNATDNSHEQVLAGFLLHKKNAGK